MAADQKRFLCGAAVVPLLDPDQMSLPDVRGTMPQAPAQAPIGSGLDFAAEVEKRANVAGTVYERLTNPKPDEPAKPGFDPEVSVPKGAEDHASIFANATGPADIAWREQQYQREQLSNRIIQSHGGWGLAAEMAGGLTDPIALASMAVPVGGATRLIQAGKLALVSGATTAVQEAAMQSLEVSRTAKDSALNIGAGTVLGGVLGAAIRPHVPARTFESMADTAHEELHGDGGEKVLGPIDGQQRIIPEVDVARPADVSTPRSKQMLDEFHEKYPEPAPVGFAGQRVGKANVDIATDPFDANTAHLEMLKADETGKGVGTAALKEVTDLADKHGVTMELNAVPQEGGPDRAKLMDIYGKQGFESVPEKGEGAMIRAPTEQPKVSPDQRISAAEAKVKAVDDYIGKLTPEQQAAWDKRGGTQGAKDKAQAELKAAQIQKDFVLPEVGKGDAWGGWKPATSEELATHTKGAKASMSQRLKETAPKGVEAPVTGEMHVNPEAESTAGAAAVSNPTMRGESIARGAGTLSNTVGRVSPGARLMNSPSIESRKLIQEMANLPETLTKNYEGKATSSPIERELWKYDGVHNQGMTARGNQYRIYRERIAGENGKPMVRGEFNQEISKAMRRGDKHQIPEVAEAARQTRAIEFDPLKARAQKAGLLSEDVQAKGADSYLMRQYDSQKIKENLTDWLQRLKEGFMKQGVDPAEAADIAHQATRNVMGSERGTMDYKVMDDIVPKSGRLKERTLDLPDSLLEPYLNNDIDHVAHSYLRSMAPEVEMTERFGSRDMKDQLSDIHDDYSRMIERAPDDKAKAKLSDQMANDLRDLTAVRDRLYGIYGQPKDPGSFAVRAGRMLRTVNALRLLGAATLAHFPDAANAMMRYGLGNTFATIGKVLTSPEAFTLGKNEAKRMGAALDMSMNATASMLGDYATHSQYAEQRVGQYLARKFTILTGETPLITAVQSLTSTMAQDTLVRTAQKVAGGQAVDKNLLARMASAGIDQDALRGIAEQHEQFGAKVNGLHFGMSDKWADQALASKFESAVLRDAHSVTLRPGVGDTPLFMSTEWGKALRQFTTFGYAAQRSVVNPLMQGLAHGDPRAAQAIFALAGMGTLSYVAKQTAAGQPIEDPMSARFALEVLDKSNLMGWTSDVIFPALWMGGFKSLSRWSDRDPTETIGGPVVGTLFSTYAKQLPGKFAASLGFPTDDDQKGINRSDLHFIRRLMPGQNLWYARNAINSLEDSIGDAFGLEGKSNADRAAEAVN
jgi:hypothetical protein